jgi:hypothetical protein
MTTPATLEAIAAAVDGLIARLDAAGIPQVADAAPGPGIVVDTSAHGGDKLADVEYFIANAKLTDTQLLAAGIQKGGMYWLDDDSLAMATGDVRDQIEQNISKATFGIQQEALTFIVASTYVKITSGPNKGGYNQVDELSDHRVFPRGMTHDRILAVIKQRIIDNGDADPNDPRFISR